MIGGGRHDPLQIEIVEREPDHRQHRIAQTHGEPERQHDRHHDRGEREGGTDAVAQVREESGPVDERKEPTQRDQVQQHHAEGDRQRFAQRLDRRGFGEPVRVWRDGALEPCDEAVAGRQLQFRSADRRSSLRAGG